MKKIALLLLSITLFYGCLNDNESRNLTFEILPIDSYIVPNEFNFLQKDTIVLTYSLKENCQFFNTVYYEYQDTARVVAISSVTDLDITCNETLTQYQYNLIVSAEQQEDYLFKFYKGKDSDGNNIFEEVVVPVN